MYDVIFDVADYLKMSCCLQTLVKDVWPNSSWLQPGFQVKRCSLCKPHQIHRTIEFMPTWLWCTCGTPFERPHAFSQSIVVSVAVLSLRKMSPVFVWPRANVNSCYYWHHSEWVFAAGHSEVVWYHSNFILQQDGAPFTAKSIVL